MSEDLLDEVTSINSIYGEDTLTKLSDNSGIYSLTLPAQVSISLRLDFPPDYPNGPLSVLGTQSVGDKVAKGAGSQLVDVVRTVLAEVYSPGAPCIFDLIEESGQRLQQLGLAGGDTADEDPRDTQADGELKSADDIAYTCPDNLKQAIDDLGDPPPWILSDVVTEKKSIFVARAAHVTSPDQAKTYLAHLLATDKKVAKATHNMTAWRIRGDNGVQYQDCDDDGETAAGGRMLHLLELMGVWDAMVVVSRWYGGVHLGPDRFRIINQTARDAIVKGGFAPTADGAKDGGKKRGKK